MTAEFRGEASAEGPQLEAVLGIDAGFLHTETSSTHWHVVGVVLLDDAHAPEPFDAEMMRRVLAERVSRVEVLRRRVVGASQPQWVLTDVDLDAHVGEAALAPGAGLPELAALAGEIASRPLRRDRPLWEFTVVDGLADGRKALVAKIHHSLVDGVAAVGVLGAIFDQEPVVPPLRPPPEPGTQAGPNRRDYRREYLGAAARTVADQPAMVARAVTRLARSAWRVVQRVRESDDEITLPLTAPRVCLSRSITGRRSAAFALLGIDEVKEIRRAFGVTFNDVVVTLAATVVRDWLLEIDELPERPLVAAIPASVRVERGGVSGNEVSALFGALPTHLSDAAERVRFVAREMPNAKAFHEDLGARTMGFLALAAPWNVAALLFRAYSDFGLANRLPPAVNLVLTSVPGPQAPLYCGGARMEALFPLGPILDGAALNVTVVSYTDTVSFGFLTCPDVCPPVEHLADAVPAAMAELLAAARAVESTPPHDARREETTMNVRERNRQALAEIQERRDEFYEGILDLERAMAVPAGDDPSAWGASTASAVDAMRGVLADHVHDTEAPGSFYDSVVAESPHLVNAAHKLKAAHGPLVASVDALASAAGSVRDDAGVDGVRTQALEVIKELLTHRHRGAELVYDAYNVDVSTGD